jgi:hypothetical protein
MKLDTLTLIDDPKENQKLSCLIDAFDWVVGLHTEFNTTHIEKGCRFVIRAASNSKIVVSFLQRRHPPSGGC